MLTKICKNYQYDRIVRRNYFPPESRLYDVMVVIWYPREAEHKRIPRAGISSEIREVNMMRNPDSKRLFKEYVCSQRPE